MNTDNAIYESLDLARQKNQLVSLHSSPDDWPKCSVGYVKFLSNDYVLIKAVDKYGFDAGYELRQISEVFRVDIGGSYENRLSFLNSNQRRIPHDIEILTSEDNMLISTLLCAKSESLAVTIVGSDKGDSISGFVSQISDRILTLKVIDDNGLEDGLSIIDLGEIASVDINTLREQSLLFLYNEQAVNSRSHTP